MCVGDLVWAYGCKGLILDVYHGTHTTEYYVFWFEDKNNPTWITKKHLVKVC